MQSSHYHRSPPGLRCAGCSSPASIVKVDDFTRPDAGGFRGYATPFCDGCCAVTEASATEWRDREHYHLRGN